MSLSIIQHKHPFIASLFCITLSIFQASAFGTELSDSLRFNGFSTFGGSMVDQKGIIYKSYSDQDGGSTENRIDWETNSLLGLQVDYDISPYFSATLQGVSRKNEKGNFSPSLEWAYLTYRATENFDIRLGLLHLPLYRNTELDYINYTRIWAVNPFISQYARGFRQLHGIDMLYYTYLEDFEITLQGSYGYDKPSLPDSDFLQEYSSNDLKVLSIEVERGLSRFKISHFNATIFYKESDKGGRPPGGTPEPSREPQSHHAQRQVTSFDLETVLSDFTLSGGMSFGNEAGIFPATRSHYASVAYPVGKYTPYFLHTGDSIFFDSSSEENMTYALGLRYDLFAGIAIKGQIDRIYPDKNGGRGLSGMDEREYYHVYTLVVDSVF